VSVDFLFSDSPEFAEMPPMFYSGRVLIFCPPIRLNLLIHLGCLQEVSIDFLSSNSPELLIHLGCLQEVSIDFLFSDSPEFAETPRMVCSG
jgi:hypothetical protein